MEAKKIQLYGSWPYRTLRCIWLARELGIEADLEIIPHDILKASKESVEKLREIHPHGTIPACVTPEGEHLLDSAAICFYLADKYDKLQPPPGQRMHYYNWPIYCVSTLDFILQPLYYHCSENPEDKWDKAVIEKHGKRFDDFGKYFTQHFKERQYVCGDEFTAADCVLGYCVWWSSFIMDGRLTSKYPALGQYLDRIKERPAFKETFKFPEEH